MAEQLGSIYEEYLNKRPQKVQEPQPVEPEPEEVPIYRSYAEWLNAYYTKHKEKKSKWDLETD